MFAAQFYSHLEINNSSFLHNSQNISVSTHTPMKHVVVQLLFKQNNGWCFHTTPRSDKIKDKSKYQNNKSEFVIHRGNDKSEILRTQT